MRSQRYPVLILPSPPWWHAHIRGRAYLLCTNRFCDKPFAISAALTGEGDTDA